MEEVTEDSLRDERVILINTLEALRGSDFKVAMQAVRRRLEEIKKACG